MAIWTSRYSNKELVENKNKYYCVGISLGTPKFPLGYNIEQQCYSLAPKGYMLRMELEKFTEEYYRKLEGIGSDRIIDMVMRFEKRAADEGKELVLLCYEDVRIPEDWCHRTVFAQWYCEKTGTGTGIRTGKEKGKVGTRENVFCQKGICKSLPGKVPGISRGNSDQNHDRQSDHSEQGLF